MNSRTKLRWEKRGFAAWFALTVWLMYLALAHAVEVNREFDEANVQDTVSTELAQFYRDYAPDPEQTQLELYEEMLVYLLMNPTCTVE